MLKKLYFDDLIIYLMFFLLPIDMINASILRSGLYLPISIAQLFKIVILILIFGRLCFKPKYLIIAVIATFTLFIPSIIQVGIQKNLSFIFSDTIKIFRYLMPLYSFLFFLLIMKKTHNHRMQKIYLLVWFSYTVIVINIFLKYLGIGYPMYEHGNIGSKGLFYAGNEISVLLVILSSIIANKLWKEGKTFFYFLLFLLSIITGIGISSKTGILGIVLVFFLVPLKTPKIQFNKKRLIQLFGLTIIFLPATIYFIWGYIKASLIYNRISFFWNKLDFWTFVLSNRNVFFKKAQQIYMDQYTFLEKIIGVGQTKYEKFNNNKIVEIDVLDIFFAYGYLGLFLFTFFIFYLMAQAIRFSKKNELYKNAKYVFLMLIILLGISSSAGHVFSSGMSAVFIGLVFSLMYLKKDLNAI